jgi:hypothetical protein
MDQKPASWGVLVTPTLIPPHRVAYCKSEAWVPITSSSTFGDLNSSALPIILTIFYTITSIFATKYIWLLFHLRLLLLIPACLSLGHRLSVSRARQLLIQGHNADLSRRGTCID